MPDNITPQDQFEEDIEFIRTTDKVLGDPPGTTGVLSGPINKVLQKIANSLLNLKTRLDGLNITVPNATTTTRGIIELATKAEMEKAYADLSTVHASPPKRVHDAIRSATAQATETTRGAAEIANQTERRSGTNNTHIMTSLGVKDFLQNGTSQATISVASGTITVRNNIQIGNLLFLRVENTGAAAIPSNTIWTLGGGAWRILSASRWNPNITGSFIKRKFLHGYVDTAEREVSPFWNVTYNNNNTTFQLSTRPSGFAPNHELNIIAVLN